TGTRRDCRIERNLIGSARAIAVEQRLNAVVKLLDRTLDFGSGEGFNATLRPVGRHFGKAGVLRDIEGPDRGHGEGRSLGASAGAERRTVARSYLNPRCALDDEGFAPGRASGSRCLGYVGDVDFLRRLFKLVIE